MAARRWFSPCSPRTVTVRQGHAGVAVSDRSAPAARTEQVARQRVGIMGIMVLGHMGGPSSSTTPAWQMQQSHCTTLVAHSTSIPELACLGAVHVQLKGPRICAHVGIRGRQDEACRTIIVTQLYMRQQRTLLLPSGVHCSSGRASAGRELTWRSQHMLAPNQMSELRQRCSWDCLRRSRQSDSHHTNNCKSRFQVGGIKCFSGQPLSSLISRPAWLEAGLHSLLAWQCLPSQHDLLFGSSRCAAVVMHKHARLSSSYYCSLL